MIIQIKKKIYNNKKVIENYSFMTMLQVFNMALSFFLYPYLVKHIGVEVYGIYLFAISFASYFDAFIELGFNGPIVKDIADNIDNPQKLQAKVSMVFTGKIIMFFLSSIIFIILLVTLPTLREHWLLYILCYLTILQNIFFPSWFFQAMENMKYVTIINLSFKLLSIFFIFWIIKSPEQINTLSLINLLGILLGSMIAMYVLVYKYKIKIYWVTIKEIIAYIPILLPIYMANLLNVVKPFAINIVIVIFFSTSDVTIVDLPMKVTNIVLIMLGSIIPAFYPKIAKQKTTDKKQIRKIFFLLFFLGILSMLFLFIFGTQIIGLLGNYQLFASIPLLNILSIRIPCYLLCSTLYTLCFFIHKKTKYIFYGLLVSVLTQIMFLIGGLWLFEYSIDIVVWSSALCAVCELGYTLFIVFKYKMI